MHCEFDIKVVILYIKYKLQIRAYAKPLPMWVSIIIILACLSFSALFSGLNLGLMSLDRTELKILCNTGTEKVTHIKLIIRINLLKTKY